MAEKNTLFQHLPYPFVLSTTLLTPTNNAFNCHVLKNSSLLISICLVPSVGNVLKSCVGSL
jgi:hypothetical protein